MWKTRVFRTCAAVLLATLLLVPRVRVIRERASEAQLLWNAEQAYLFIGTVRTGWEHRVARALGSVALGLLGVFDLPTASARSTIVAFISPDGVRTQVYPGVLRPIGVMDGRVTDGTTTWPFGGEPSPETDRERWDLGFASVEFADREGWSKVTLSATGDPRRACSLVLNGTPATIVLDRVKGTTTVTVQGERFPVAPVWSAPAGPQFVSRATFEEAFRN
jgi:hypothetical protein